MIRNDESQSIPLDSTLPAVRGRAVTMMFPGGEMTGADGSATGAANLDGYLHAFRRTWLWCLIAGGVLAVAAGGAVWTLVPETFTAVAELQASTRAPRLMKSDASQPGDKYETFISNMQQYLQSRSTISAALDSPDPAALSLPDPTERTRKLGSNPMVEQESEQDPDGWLASRLRVSNPKNSEILKVSVTAQSPEVAMYLTNAVVNACVNEVDKRERGEKLQKVESLEKYLQDQTNAQVVRRAQLEALAAELGSTDKDALSFQQQMSLQQAQMIKNERARTGVEIMKGNAELEVLEAQLAGAENLEIPPAELDVLVDADPLARAVSDELKARENEIAQALAISKTSGNTLTVSNAALGAGKQRVKELKDKLAEIEDALKARWKVEQHKALQAAYDLKLAELKSLDGFDEQLLEKEESYDKQFLTLGKQSFELEQGTKEVELLSSLVDRLSQEAQLARIDLESGGRLEILAPAVKPMYADRPGKRVLAAMAGLLAFVIPGVGFVLLDVRAQRVNSVREVEHRLGLPVFGSVPMLPAAATRGLDTSSRRGRRWQAMLSEAVSGIRANLLRLNDVRVVMVTSSVGGEGKTTVATQLAMSLARIGKRTVLVDFDLPRPALNSVFDLPLEPGICDVLRNDYQLTDVVADVSLPNLSVITSGIADAASARCMNSVRLVEVLDELRDRYEYVIVDGSPLIPVADARVVSRYVDGAICCVLRDVSRLRLVRQAADILANFKVRLLGTVVTAKQDAYYLSYGGDREEKLESTGV